MLVKKQELLSRIRLFSGLAPAEVEAVAQNTIERSYAPGELLFAEGEPCEGMYIIGTGSVKIFKTSPSGRQITLAVEPAPSTVAEIPLFDGGPFPASVAALDDVWALFIHKRDFQRLCLAHPAVPIKALAVVGRRLRILVGMIESVTFGSVRQRLAQSLLDWAGKAGGATFLLPATHQEIALNLGTVREVVSRNLSRFQAEGLLEVNRREITVLDEAGLRREAETEF
ncbi:MAG: Crp/Fnr family transcriptional regulator [Acidobacteria bacterium]|nr:Crp/Fnr family transcriptional regulator [Acidobacteriota bacterium]MBI3471698.1 Crp/Fnr family transcriptional regulator [Candidatus Solibacter usitatus]